MTAPPIDNITKIDPDTAFRMFALMEAAKAIAAIEELEQLFAVRVRINDVTERRENGSLFEKLRLILTHMASVSRIFWAASDKSKVRSRCHRLRQMAKIPEDHALSDRALRNHIEHFDERLDDWLGDASRPFTGFEIAVHRDMNARTVDALLVSVPVILFEKDLEIRLFGHRFSLPTLKAALVDIRDRISISFEQ